MKLYRIIALVSSLFITSLFCSATILYDITEDGTRTIQSTVSTFSFKPILSTSGSMTIHLKYVKSSKVIRGKKGKRQTKEINNYYIRLTFSQANYGVSFRNQTHLLFKSNNEIVDLLSLEGDDFFDEIEDFDYFVEGDPYYGKVREYPITESQLFKLFNNISKIRLEYVSHREDNYEDFNSVDGLAESFKRAYNEINEKLKAPQKSITDGF